MRLLVQTDAYINNARSRIPTHNLKHQGRAAAAAAVNARAAALAALPVWPGIDTRWTGTTSVAVPAQDECKLHWHLLVNARDRIDIPLDRSPLILGRNKR